MTDFLYVFFILICVYFAIDNATVAFYRAMNGRFGGYAFHFFMMIFWIVAAVKTYQEWNP